MAFVPKNYNTNGGDETVIGGKLTIKADAVVEGLDATTKAPGLVRKASKVAEAKGETPTAKEFNALLKALKDAGIMAK